MKTPQQNKQRRDTTFNKKQSHLMEQLALSPINFLSIQDLDDSIIFEIELALKHYKKLGTPKTLTLKQSIVDLTDSNFKDINNILILAKSYLSQIVKRSKENNDPLNNLNVKLPTTSIELKKEKKEKIEKIKSLTTEPIELKKDILNDIKDILMPNPPKTPPITDSTHYESDPVLLALITSIYDNIDETKKSGLNFTSNILFNESFIRLHPSIIMPYIPIPVKNTLDRVFRQILEQMKLSKI